MNVCGSGYGFVPSSYEQGIEERRCIIEEEHFDVPGQRL
jgi:hypothetical protein